MPTAASVVSAKVIRERYYWPNAQLNMWTILTLVTGSLELGVFAQHSAIQNQMRLSSPWIFPFGITVGAITIVVIAIENALIAQRRLLPGLMMLFAFTLLVLYLTGLIETGIVLFGSGGVQRNCQAWVNNSKQTGPSILTLAWLEQQTICNIWYASFSFWILGVLLFIWMLVMASQVAQGQFDNPANRNGLGP